MSNDPGVCPSCGSKKITYGADINNHYAGGNTDDRGRMGYAAVCDDCGTSFIEFWKFDEMVINIPGWLNPGAWVYDANERWFARVTNVSSHGVVSIIYKTDYDVDSRTTSKSLKYIMDVCIPAEIKRYTNSQLFTLPGTEVVSETGVIYTVQSVTKTKYKDGSIVCKVHVGDSFIEADELVEKYHHRNGLPCGELITRKNDRDEVHTAGYAGV